MKKLFSLLTAILFVGSMWGADVNDTYDFKANGITKQSGPNSGAMTSESANVVFVSKDNTDGNNNTDSWTIEFLGSTSYQYGKNTGVQFGGTVSSVAYAPNAQMTSKSYSKVSQVRVITSTSNSAVSVTVKVGGVNFDSKTITTGNTQTQTFSNASTMTGAVTIVVYSATTTLVKIEKIIITTYTAGPTPGTITPDPTSVSVPAAGDDNGSITVAYTDISASYVDAIALYDDADHTMDFSGGWMDADWSDDSKTTIEYIVDANTGDARTAYIYIYAIDDYSNEIEKVIPVTQGKGNVASLPFAFNGGKSDIDNKAGLTQSNLGNDYGTAPKLKFDNTNDELVLRIGEAGGKLSFDIKGNPAQDAENINGTFKVRESADGETYTDLATYSNFGKDVLSKEINNIASTTRYIKWIYSSKTAGNVALGNISLLKSGTTSLEDVETSVKAVKVLRNGVLYIEKAGKTYNILGNLVK